MENLVIIENGQAVVSSRDVARNFCKAHGDVLKSIDSLVRENSLTKNMFFETSREYRGQAFRYYLMNRDGFSLLVMGFTGAKALEWKLKYIQAFNAMEQQLKATAPADDLKAKRLEVMQRNANAKVARLWLQISNNTQNQTYKEICNAYAANVLAEKEVLALPVATEKTYSAAEIGKMLDISASKVGRIANANGLKTEEYGRYYHDKSRYSNKEVETFRYYECAIDAFQKIIAAKGGNDYVA